MEKIKVIVVDDEPRILKRMVRMVEDDGEVWEIIGAFSDGKEAIEKIEEKSLRFDLLLTDVQMPEITGLQLIKRLKDKMSFESIIISGFDDFVYLQSAIKEGVSNYLLKPVHREQLKEVLLQIQKKIETKRKEEKEKQQLQRKAEELDYTKQIYYLSQLQLEDYLREDKQKWLQLIGKGSFQLLYISIDQNRNQTWSDEYLAWLKVANEDILSSLKISLEEWSSSSNRRKWLWRDDLFSIWILIEHQESQHLRKETEALLRLWKENIKNISENTVTIAVGSVFTNMVDYLTNRKKLESVMQNRMIYGCNKVFWLEQLPETSEESKKHSSEIIKSIQQLLFSLENEGKKEVIISLEEYFKKLQLISSASILEEAVQLLGLRIVNRWVELEGFGEERILFREVISLTKNTSNFYQLKDKIKFWVLSVMERIQKAKRTNKNPIQKAKDYIQDHLGESITIKLIAQQVYMSPTYFSVYFKEQTGETILDYITKTRLKKATDLLETTDLKIYDIAVQLGYQDTKYFSRLFRQWYGYTPSQYREAHLKR
ncbi:MAG: response regulator [Bacillus sp. (in: Bacteria)]|uniref:Response regulator n=1 Tax=Niallia circulans TaxID=1397 RepID=A0A941GJT0_NIACI|nr:helix-turn-helix domain-containing protein [Niallia circulans]MBQ6449002.1 response regulator [Bacillus sp. (in: firmicutes)]MCB5239227.1 response regulator [Niallia circulans]